MTVVKVLAVRRHPPDAPVVATADVQLDAAVTILGVRIMESFLTARLTAIPPVRGADPRRPILSWSDPVGQQITTAVLAALDKEVAT
jgi:hypothetical protein